MKKIILLMLTLLSIISCNEEDVKDTEITAISFDKKEIILKAGESYKLTVNCTPNNAKLPTLGWIIREVTFDFITHSTLAGPAISDDGVITSSRGCTLTVDVYSLKTSGERVSDLCQIRFTPSIKEIYEAKYYGFIVKDTSNLIVLGCDVLANNNDITYLSGVKNDKLWIGQFNTTSKTLISDFVDSERFDLNRKLHIGYGEYIDLTVNSSKVKAFYSSNGSWAAEICLMNKDKDRFNESNVFIFKAQNSSKKYFRDRYSFNTFRKWYKDSYLAYVDIQDQSNSNNLFTCFSNKGDVIISGHSDYLIEDNCYPLDYDKLISFVTSYYNDGEKMKPCIGTHISEIKEGGLHTGVSDCDILLPCGENFKFTSSLINRNNNIMVFKFDIIEYTGEQHSHEVKIDLDTKEYRIL